MVFLQGSAWQLGQVKKHFQIDLYIVLGLDITISTSRTFDLMRDGELDCAIVKVNRH